MTSGSRPLTVALLADTFMSWGGGIDFLRLCANGLAAIADDHPLRLVLVVPEGPPPGIRALQLAVAIRDSLRHLVRGRPPALRLPARYDSAPLLDAFQSVNTEVRFAWYAGSRRSLVKCLRSLEADVVLPAHHALGADFPLPWVGYVFDFQHRAFPEFFTPKTRGQRDRAFRTMLTQARVVCANSREVCRDVTRFVPEATSEVLGLPFAPIPVEAWLQPPFEDVRARYGISGRFFLVSNQFFVHKDHRGALRALAHLREGADCGDVSLVFTGKMDDPRFPAYPDELRALVNSLGLEGCTRFLGHIPKVDQIRLMQEAIAVLQPTLFEGGPGGGSVYDAVALGIPAVVSDIPVNQEIVGEDLTFFRAGDPEAIAAGMRELLARPPREPVGPAELVRRGQARARALGLALWQAIEAVRGPLP